jgi:hypothetical protein
MVDPARSKLPPARPPTPKPASVRDLTAEAPPQQSPPAVQEAEVTVDGETWTVRVLGRSGRASGASPPLLLLGFWGMGDSEDSPTREVLVVGESLDDLTIEGLEVALSRAEKPRSPDRKVGFFQDVAQGRRRRTNENI